MVGDAYDNTMCESEQAAQPLYCLSVGWLVSEPGGCKVIVPHLAERRMARPFSKVREISPSRTGQS